LHSYRGKYDHNENEISERIFFNFEIRIFGKCGKQKQLKWEDDEYIIPCYNKVSNFGLSFTIDNREISSLTVAGFVHLHCFFNEYWLKIYREDTICGEKHLPIKVQRYNRQSPLNLGPFFCLFFYCHRVSMLLKIVFL